MVRCRSNLDRRTHYKNQQRVNGDIHMVVIKNSECHCCEAGHVCDEAVHLSIEIHRLVYDVQTLQTRNVLNLGLEEDISSELHSICLAVRDTAKEFDQFQKKAAQEKL